MGMRKTFNELTDELNKARELKNALENERKDLDKMLNDACNLNNELRNRIQQTKAENSNGRNLKVKFKSNTFKNLI